MQSGKIVNAEVGEEHRAKADYTHYGHPLSPPAPDEPGVEHCGIDKPCYQRPCLLWIPAPVGSPRGVGPHRAGDNTQREKDKANNDTVIGKLVQDLSSRQEPQERP